MKNKQFQMRVSLHRTICLCMLAMIVFIGKIYGGHSHNFNLSENELSQQKTVTGKVTDSQGLPLPGVSITVKSDSTKGVATDFDGNYSIEVSPSDVLIFSYIGFSSQEVPVQGQSQINVVLKESAQELDQVVVTALGIKRAEKTLSYAQQKVDSDEITKTKDINFVNSLSGKTSGIQLTKSASGAGGSSKIILRGNKSIVGVSSPLFVIDGIPMSNSNNNTGGDFFEVRDKSDALSQINPDDIESITVLKGSNAAILYGSQGANGVIMITTKKGKEGKLSGNISSSLTFEQVMELPDFQYRYGAEGNATESWSNKKGNYDNSFIKDFFDTGINVVNSLSLSGGSATNASYLSYSNTLAEGVVPQNEYNKHNLTIKQDSKFLNNKLNISAKVMLTKEKIHNKPTLGYYFNPLTGLYWFPRNLNFSDYRNNYQKFDKERNIQTQNWHAYAQDKQQNPFWVIYNNTNESNLKRLITSLNISYDLTNNLKLQVRGNYDYATSSYNQKIKAGTSRAVSADNGRWRYTKTEDTQLYADAILSYSKDFEDFTIHSLVGSSYESKVLGDGVNVDSDMIGLKFANEFMYQNLNPGNLVENVLTSRLVKQSAFGNIELGYKNSLFVDISGRNDWASSLAFTDNFSYFYPSFGVSALINEMVTLPQVFNLMKLRGSYSIISNEVPAFITNPLSSIGRNGLDVNTKKPFTELKAEKQKSFELGLDIRLFTNRLGLDITYYDINTENQFLDLPAPSGSGYTRYYVNAGHIQNKGLEVTLNATPIKGKGFTWDTNINYTLNKNKIISLHEDLKGRYSLGDSDGYALYITEGGSFGDIYVNKFERDAQGRILISDKGAPVRTNEKEYVGNSQPKFLLGWNNNISYKNFNLSFLIDGKFGGKAVSLTNAMLDSYGVSEATAVARDNGGVTVNGVTESGTLVTTVKPQIYYQTVGGRDGIIENYVYDATNVRLRQLSLTYNLNLKEKGWFFNSLSTSLIANNLFFLYKKAPFDPDFSMSTGNNMQAVSLFTIPSTRNYGMSLKLNF